ncbi:MAG TPA: aldo/keto reductase [Steroidobacteraceae bacterium]|nr:aldo/keto reductase [Steroidobacteraceae bacterium]
MSGEPLQRPLPRGEDSRAILERLRHVAPYGFGASSLGNLYRPVEDEVARQSVVACWECGIRYFDTAPYYGFGLSERRLGDALRGFDRSEYLLSTKVGRLLHPVDRPRDQCGFHSPMPFDPVYDYSYDGVMRSFEASLHRLGLSRIDILYAHDLGSATHGPRHAEMFATAMDSGYRALAELRRQCVVGAIGLGVNEVEVCEASLAHADFDLFMVAGRHTLLNHRSLDFLERCRRRGIGVVAAGVFNSGILATGASAGQRGHYDYETAPPQVTARVAELETICRDFDVPLPAAALQFAAAHPAVTCVVIGTADPRRVRENAALARLPIPAAFWGALRQRGLLSVEAPVPSNDMNSSRRPEEPM